MDDDNLCVEVTAPGVRRKPHSGSLIRWVHKYTLPDIKDPMQNIFNNIFKDIQVHSSAGFINTYCLTHWRSDAKYSVQGIEFTHPLLTYLIWHKLNIIFLTVWHIEASMFYHKLWMTERRTQCYVYSTDLRVDCLDWIRVPIPGSIKQEPCQSLYQSFTQPLLQCPPIPLCLYPYAPLYSLPICP